MRSQRAIARQFSLLKELNRTLSQVYIHTDYIGVVNDRIDDLKIKSEKGIVWMQKFSNIIFQKRFLAINC